ncbi:MAG TPA: GrpB family protein, partial [Marmoricola sp.]|nr:GrpB family protein [Marmoricola sp.]
NLHVFSPGAIEPQRHRAFRDWLREHDDDRDAYAALKRDLATRPFDSVMDYTAGKGALVYESYERIFAADPEHPHTPQPLGRAATAG